MKDWEDLSKPEEEKPKWKLWAKGKKPSMKRRMQGFDYCKRGIYMITIAIEGRRPLLGMLKGIIKESTVNDEKEIGINGSKNLESAYVELSPMGEKVKECWMSIPYFHSEVEVMKLCIMPDHIHGILFVHENMEKPLGKIIEGFKIGTRKAARELGIMGTSLSIYPALSVQEKQNRHTAAGRSHGKLWEQGYNDRILMHKGQLDRAFAYLDDNPHRLWIKRQHPEFFTQLGTLTVAGMGMQAIGNRFLLDNPEKIQVQCSRHLYPQEIEQKKTAILEKVEIDGAVLVSPCISPGEQQIATAALEKGLPLIVLLLNGLSPFFKPKPRYLQACSEGCLLILAPFPYQNEKITNMRQRCLQLNNIAAEICKQ